MTHNKEQVSAQESNHLVDNRDNSVSTSTVETAGYQHALDGCTFIYHKTVEWGDMDALGHVNNVVYHSYAEATRINYLIDLNVFTNVFLVIAKATCTYLRPVVFPDTLHIGIECKKIGNSSMVLEYIFFSEQQQLVVATSETILVRMDQTGHATQQWSEEERQKVLG